MIVFNEMSFHSRNILSLLGEKKIKKQKTSFIYLSKAGIRQLWPMTKLDTVCLILYDPRAECLLYFFQKSKE